MKASSTIRKLALLAAAIPLLGGGTHAVADTASTASSAFSTASAGIQATLAATIQFFTDLDAALKAIDPNMPPLQLQDGAVVATVLGIPYKITAFIRTSSIGVQGPRLDAINGTIYFTDSLGNCYIIQLG